MALAAWAAAQAGEFALLAQAREADAELVGRALEVVRAFVAARGLVVFGGLAIDFALRLRGEAGLYPPGARPDFDFFSPRGVDDAYDLAELLEKEGFPEVAAIRAVHVQTVRVRTAAVFVADVGSVPPSVFAALPTLEFEGLRFVHPDFQRMDMHLAFCFPYNGAPREDIAHRWGKDLLRLRRLAAAYPVAGGKTGPGGRGGRAACALAHAAGAPPPPRADPRAGAFHGFAAYALLRRELDALAAALGAPPPEAPPRLGLEVREAPGGWAVEADCPAGPAELVFAAADPEAFAGPGAPLPRRRAPFLDLCPPVAEGAGFSVFSTRGRRLGAALVRLGDGPGGPGAPPLQAYVVSPQYLLLWLLYRAFRAGEGAERETFRAFYAHTLEALAAAGRLFAGALAGAADPGARAAVLAAFVASPFAPSVETLGGSNVDAAYSIAVASAAERAREAPPPVLGVDAAGLLQGLPANWRPPGARPPFDYTANPLFGRDGELLA
jgi:hypothetical protein